MADNTQEIQEREKWYEESIYGCDDQAADIAWEMLKEDKEVDARKALGFVYIEPGSVQFNGETIKVDKGFWMCKYETPQRMWQWVLGENPAYHKGVGSLPIEQISYDDVTEKFIPALKKIFPKIDFAIPTETKWKYAALGGNKSKGYAFPGSDDLDEVAWHAGNSGGHTQPVGKKKPNELGLYDMCGNAFEWIEVQDEK